MECLSLRKTKRIKSLVVLKYSTLMYKLEFIGSDVETFCGAGFDVFDSLNLIEIKDLFEGVLSDDGFESDFDKLDIFLHKIT